MRCQAGAVGALLLALVAGGLPGQSVSVGDARIRYDERGRGDALVLIHGWTNDQGYWDAQVPELSRRYRLIRYDRRGWGESTGFPDVSADPTDLAALLDSLGVTAISLTWRSLRASTAHFWSSSRAPRKEYPTRADDRPS